MVLHLNNLESPSPKIALCQIWLKMAQWFWIRRFLNFVNVFYYFVIILLWKRAGSFICRNLNLLHSRMLHSRWFWRGRFLKFVNVFSLFHNYLPLEMGVALHFNKLKSHHPKMLCAKFVWYWPGGSEKEDFFQISSMYICYFVIISP